VILQSLTLRDVGTFADEQTLQFAPPDPERPITLVHGLNGAGKTTIIRSLFHALYGGHALPLIGRKGGYEQYLREITRHGKQRAELELRIAVPGGGLGDELLIKRSWGPRKSRVEERLDVFRDGTYDESLSEAWLEVVETFAPRSVARLFLFDGEQVEALADLETAAATIKSALGSLLGLDVVDQLVDDLAAVRRRAVKATVGDQDRSRLDALEAELHAAQQLLEEARRERELAQGSFDRARAEDVLVEEAYLAAGGDQDEHRQDLEAQLDAAAIELTMAQAAVKTLAARPEAPLMLVLPQLGSLRERAASDGERSAVALLEERDAWLLRLLGEFQAPEPVTTALAARLVEDRERRGAPEPGPRLVSTAASLGQLLERTLPELRGEVLQALDRLEQAQQAVEQLQRRLARLPSTESLRVVLAARAESAERVAAAREELREVNDHVALRERAVEKATTRRDQEVSTLADREVAATSAERVIEHSAKVQGTLQAFRVRAASRQLGRIAEYMHESLDALLRKEGLVGHIAIDEETFEVRLSDAVGRLIPTSSLSAGERQLTALAMLWAMARASGRPLPIVVDTPLGRLDQSHRMHVVERYLPAASHQVVVLSTDTEIVGPLLESLSPHIGLKADLVFDQPNQSTRITSSMEVHA
jgi:DNA sulfur modification protein DndD